MPETATLDTPAAAELKCKFCSRTFTTKPGLTNHAKLCQSNPDRANVTQKVPEAAQPAKTESKAPSYGKPVSGNGDTRRSEHHERPERHERSERAERPDRSDWSERSGDRGDRGERQPRPDNGTPFQMDNQAFIMFPDHVAMMLDINFCIALADHILENGSPNKAITAFGHRLRRLDE